MGTKCHDLKWIQTQLTLARWYLDAASSAAAEAMRNNLRHAQSMYDVAMRALSQLDVDEDQRASIERELSELRARLETAEERM